MTDKPANRIVFGIVLMLGFALCMAISDSMAKQLSSSEQVTTIVWYRYVFHTITLAILATLYYLKTRECERFGSHTTQIIRGLVLVLSTFVFFKSIAIMPLADAMALLYIFPIVAVILSIIFLKERLSKLQIFLTLAGFAGVMLVLGPSTDMYLKAGMYAIIAGVLLGIYMFLTKAMTKGATPFASSIYTGIIGIIVIPFLPGFELALFQSTNLILGCLMGAFAATGHFLMFISMRSAAASVVSPFAFSEIIFASVASYFWFNDALTQTSLAGIALIIISGTMLAIYSNRKSAPVAENS